MYFGAIESIFGRPVSCSKSFLSDADCPEMELNTDVLRSDKGLCIKTRKTEHASRDARSYASGSDIFSTIDFPCKRVISKAAVSRPVKVSSKSCRCSIA